MEFRRVLFRSHAWKACWGQPLTSSNLVSSASLYEAERRAPTGCAVGAFVVSGECLRVGPGALRGGRSGGRRRRPPDRRSPPPKQQVGDAAGDSATGPGGTGGVARCCPCTAA